MQAVFQFGPPDPMNSKCLQQREVSAKYNRRITAHTSKVLGKKFISPPADNYYPLTKSYKLAAGS